MEFQTSYLSFYVLVSVGRLYTNAYFFYSARAAAQVNNQSSYLSAYPSFGIVVFNQNGFTSHNINFITGSISNSNLQQLYSKSFVGSLFLPNYQTYDGLIGYTIHTFLNFNSIPSKSLENSFNSSGFESHYPAFTVGLIHETSFIFIQSILGLLFDSLSLISFYSVSSRENLGSIEYQPLTLFEILFGNGAYQTDTDLVIKKNKIGVINADKPSNILATILFNAVYANGLFSEVTVELWEDIKVIKEGDSFYWYAALIVKEKKEI